MTLAKKLGVEELPSDRTTFEIAESNSALTQFLAGVEAKQKDYPSIPPITSQEIIKLRRKLTENPDKLNALLRMTSDGGKPVLTEITEEGIFIFDELAEPLPPGRENLTFAQAKAAAAAYGGRTTLLHKDRYYSLGKKQGISLSPHPCWVWLDGELEESKFKNSYCIPRDEVDSLVADLIEGVVDEDQVVRDVVDRIRTVIHHDEGDEMLEAPTGRFFRDFPIIRLKNVLRCDDRGSFRCSIKV